MAVVNIGVGLGALVFLPAAGEYNLRYENILAQYNCPVYLQSLFILMCYAVLQRSEPVLLINKDEIETG